jgi:kinesin family protein 6/9
MSQQLTQKPVKVCVRTRPTHHFAQDNINIDQEHGTIQINSSRDGAPQPCAILNNRNTNFKFRVDHVFHNASQAQVYDLYAHDIVMGVIDGINGAIMKYGQTGSGKTYSMFGGDDFNGRGLSAFLDFFIFFSICL